MEHLRHARFNFEDEIQALVARQRLKHVAQPPQQVPHFERRFLDRDVARLDFRKVQHVTDYRQQRVAALLDRVQILHLLARQGRALHQVRHSHDGVERRPHLMAEVRQKLALRPVRRLRRVARQFHFPLMPLAWVDVRQHQHQPVVHPRRRQPQPPLQPWAGIQILPLVGLAGARHALIGVPQLLAREAGQQRLQSALHGGIRRQPGQLLRRRVGQQDFKIPRLCRRLADRPQHYDPVRQAFQHPRQQRLLRVDVRLRPLAIPQKPRHPAARARAQHQSRQQSHPERLLHGPHRRIIILRGHVHAHIAHNLPRRIAQRRRTAQERPVFVAKNLLRGMRLAAGDRLQRLAVLRGRIRLVGLANRRQRPRPPCGDRRIIPGIQHEALLPVSHAHGVEVKDVREKLVVFHQRRERLQMRGRAHLRFVLQLLVHRHIHFPRRSHGQNAQLLPHRFLQRLVRQPIQHPQSQARYRKRQQPRHQPAAPRPGCPIPRRDCQLRRRRTPFAGCDLGVGSRPGRHFRDRFHRGQESVKGGKCNRQLPPSYFIGASRHLFSALPAAHGLRKLVRAGAPAGT